MTDLTNLLPDERKRMMRRNYFLRLGTVAALLLAFVIVLHGAMLIPSYAYLSQDIQSKETRVASLSSSNLTPDEKAASAELSALSGNAAYLSRLADVPTISAAVKLVLGVPRRGIVLSGLALSPQEGTTTLGMAVTGTAATRESLHDYVLALQGEPWIGAATLPISAYAQDTAVPFTITLTGSSISP